MIRKFLNRVLRKSKPASPGASHHVIPRAKHGIKPEQVNACALKTVTVLKEAGHAAFIVGGAVRDMVLGRQPKDFDVATDATPEQVRALFRRSRIIGRRFRLVHVMCGQDTIEVSTFRGSAADFADEGEDEAESNADSAVNENGRILRDNVFGSQEQDAKRRDFTTNALYYDPVRQEVWDYLGGFDDLKAGELRIIGDPDQRYREDPVRMLRAARFAAKLNFRIDPATRAPIARLADLLEGVPKARLFDELQKLLLSGHALRGVHQLRAEGLHHGLLPLLDVILEQPVGERFISLALKNTDDRIGQGKPVTPAFLLAALLWHEVLAAFHKFEGEGLKPIPALNEAMNEVLDAQAEQLAIPRRFDATMKEIWGLQSRFAQRAGARPFRLLSHPRFRAGYDFLLLRCESGEVDAELGQWWTEFQFADEEAREKMLLVETAPKKRRRRRKTSSGAAPLAEGEA
jgi:poly(A) polymerase